MNYQQFDDLTRGLASGEWVAWCFGNEPFTVTPYDRGYPHLGSGRFRKEYPVMLRHRIPTLLLLTVLCLVLLLASTPPSAQAADGTAIAFVRSTEQDGDQIWLVAPDGRNAHPLYAPGLNDTYDHTHLGALSWKPDATKLAFSSDREAICSIYEYDLYSVRPDGSGYRRITNAPACAELAHYPKGSVKVPVENYLTESVGIYVQGAAKAKLSPVGTVGTVTFDDVADLGALPQGSAAMYGYGERWPGVGVDVVAGATVNVPHPLTIWTSGYETVGAYWPAWHSSGDQLAYVYSLNTLRALPAQPALLAAGSSLLAAGATLPLIVSDLAWSPNPAQANQLLYRSFDVEPPYAAIYRVTPGSTGAGEMLVSRSVDGQDFLGLAWLPDGSGFVYSQTEPGEWGAIDHGNIYAYSFSSGQGTQLTDFAPDDYPARLSVSPDGQQIVFERTTARDRSEPSDLWVLDREGGQLQLLVRNAHSPAWSPQPLPQPPPSRRPGYLPLLAR